MLRTEVTKKCCPAKALSSQRRVLSFRPTGEFFLRSLVFARDNRPRPVTLAPLRLCGRHGLSDLFLDSEFQIFLASICAIPQISAASNVGPRLSSVVRSCQTKFTPHKNEIVGSTLIMQTK